MRTPASSPGFFFWRIRLGPRLAFAAVLLVTAACYWVGLGGPLVFDDVQNLVPVSEWIRGERHWRSVVFGNDSGWFGRPVSMASFVLNVAATGPDVWGLKLGNLLLHLANGIAVFALFSILSRKQALVRGVDNRWLPLLGASLWLLHPLLASTVLYVIQRMAMLAALFVLLSLVAYVHGRIALEAGRTRKAAGLFALAAACTLAGTLSKENGALAPALCAVIEWCVFAPAAGRPRHWASRAVIGLFLLLPALAALALTVAGHPLVTGGYENRPFSLDERLMTQARVLWDYIGALVLPHGPRMGLYHDDFPVSRGFLDPATTALAFAGWGAVLALAWRWRRAVPGLLLGLGIYLVGQAFESSVFPLLLYFEHRVYLPAVGAAWALLSLLAWGGARLQPRMDAAPRVFTVAAVALVAALAVATAARARAWQSQATLTAQALRYHPESRWLRVTLIQQAMAGTPPALEEARGHAARLSASTDPSTRRLGTVLGLMITCSSGGTAAEDTRAAAFSGRPEPIEADLLVAFEALLEGLLRKPCDGLPPAVAAESLDAMLDRTALAPGHMAIWRLRLKAAKLEMAAGRDARALEQARQAWADGAGGPPAGLLAAALLLQRGDTAAAGALLESVEAMVPAEDAEGKRLVREYRAEIDRRREPVAQ